MTDSFIGACVEMSGDLHSITLISEYCAKGALDDILENKDIKLDPMFISSFIHDLIKVNEKGSRRKKSICPISIFDRSKC